MLEGKAKKLFEVWFDHTYYVTEEFSNPDSWLGIEEFYNLGLSFQWGVILEFADSEGYIIEIDYHKHSKAFDFWINEDISSDDNGWSYTRKEAQLQAIKKLNELLNK